MIAAAIMMIPLRNNLTRLDQQSPHHGIRRCPAPAFQGQLPGAIHVHKIIVHRDTSIITLYFSKDNLETVHPSLGAVVLLLHTVRFSCLHTYTLWLCHGRLNRPWVSDRAFGQYAHKTRSLYPCNSDNTLPAPLNPP